MPQERRVVIIAGGEIKDLSFLRSRIDALSPEAVICADSGARHLRDSGVVPRMIVGDMDSLPADLLDAFAGQGVEIRRYRADKDETDAELAFEAACEFRPSAIFVFGALGYRLDHTLANLSLLLKGAERHIPVTLLDRWCEVFLITGTCTIEGKAGQTVSLLPLFGEATGVSLSGFHYPLENGTMVMTSPFGISNRLSRDRATVSLKSGSLVAIRYFQRDEFPS